MLLIIRSNNVYSDPRVDKYLKYLNQKGIEYRILGWDRQCENIAFDKGFFYTLKSGYGIGGTKAIMHRIGWMLFVFIFLIKNRSRFHVIHACDLDAAYPACVFKFLVKKQTKIIFDVFDWFSATLYNQNKFVLHVFQIMEKFVIKQSDEVIICEVERIQQIPYMLNKKELVLPNIPFFENLAFLKLESKFKFNNDKITFSYVGGLYHGRLLIELFLLAERGLINLLLAGYGSPELELKCQQLSLNENVKYYRKVDYQTALKIMFNSDIIYAMYSRSNPNHIYAAPNKYYEAMMLGKPIISNSGTILEMKILKANIGFIVEETFDDLANQITKLEMKLLKEKGIEARKLWEAQFINYTRFFMDNVYLSIIHK